MLNNIMVCVTQQKTSEKLIKVGYDIFKEMESASLFVIHVVNENDKLLYNLSDGDALEYLFEITKELGADLVVKRSKNVVSTLIDFAQENSISHVVMGSAGNVKVGKNFEQKLKAKLKDIEFIIV